LQSSGEQYKYHWMSTSEWNTYGEKNLQEVMVVVVFVACLCWELRLFAVLAHTTTVGCKGMEWCWDLRNIIFCRQAMWFSKNQKEKEEEEGEEGEEEEEEDEEEKEEKELVNFRV
jgi:hypothetical protein